MDNQSSFTKMRAYLLYAIFSGLISHNCLSNEVANEEILCVPESTPYSGSQLPNGGPLTKVVVKTLNLAGINVKVKHAPWARILHDAENGKCLILGLWPTEQRKSIFHFSIHPIVKQELALYTTNNKNSSWLQERILAVHVSVTFLNP